MDSFLVQVGVGWNVFSLVPESDGLTRPVIVIVDTNFVVHILRGLALCTSSSGCLVP